MLRLSRILTTLLLLTLASCLSVISPPASDPTPNTSASAPTAQVGTPALSYALMDSSDGLAQFDQYLALSSVDGIAIRLSWDTLETSEGNYTWTKINEAFTSATTYNKKVTLHILSSVYGATPNWVYAAGAASFTYYKPPIQTVITKTDPVPWNATYLSKWTNFLTALESHLDTSGYLSRLEFISVGSPVPEMSIVACAGGDITGSYAGTVTYNRTNYLNAWKNFVLTSYTIFPNTKHLLPAPVQHICMADSDGGNFYKEVFEYAQTLSTTKFYHYATDLKATGTIGSQRIEQIPTAPTNIRSLADIALQYTWSYTDDGGVKLGGSFNDATCEKGLKTLEAIYFEVYKLDLLNGDLQATIDSIQEPWLCP